MTALDIPPWPLEAATAQYEELCRQQSRAPAIIPQQPAQHATAVDPRHYLQQAVVMAAHAVDRAQDGVAEAQRRLARARREYAGALGRLREGEGQDQ